MESGKRKGELSGKRGNAKGTRSAEQRVSSGDTDQVGYLDQLAREGMNIIKRGNNITDGNSKISTSDRRQLDDLCESTVAGWNVEVAKNE